MDRNHLFYNNTTTTTTTSLSGFYPQAPSQTSDTINNQTEEPSHVQYVGKNTNGHVLLPNSSGDTVHGMEHLMQEEEEEEEEEEGEDAAIPMSLSARQCSVRGCPTTLDDGDANKMCQHCRERHRIYANTKRAKRKREKSTLTQATIHDAHTPASHMPTFNGILLASAQDDGSSGVPSASDRGEVSLPNMGVSASWETEATLTRPARLLRTTGSRPWQNAIHPSLFDAKLLSNGIDSTQHPTVSSSSTLAHALTPVTRTVPPPPPLLEGVLAEEEEEEEENEVLATLHEEPLRFPESKATVPRPEDELAEGDGNIAPRVCSVKGCKTAVEASYEHKMCPRCRVKYQKYGTTKRAKWKAEREAFDREMAVLRKKEDARRKNEGLPPLSKLPEELRQWELSILEELSLPDVQTLANMTLATASGTHPTFQGMDPTNPTPDSTQLAHSTLTTPTSLTLAAISPIVAASIYQRHLTSNFDENGKVMTGDDINPGSAFVHPLLVGHLAPYVEGVVSSASEANKAKRRTRSANNTVDETPASALHNTSVDISNSSSPQLAYPPSPSFSDQHQTGEAASSMSSDTSVALDTSSRPVPSSVPLSTPTLTPTLTPLPARMCTISHCHRILPGYYRYKRCEQHRLQNRYHSKLKRIREKEGIAGGHTSSGSPLLPSTPSGALAGTSTIPGTSGPAQEDTSSATLLYADTGLTPYVEQISLAAGASSSSVHSVDSGPGSSTRVTTQPQEESSGAGPPSYYRHMSDPVEDAKALALIMAEEDVMGVYAFKEKMKKRLLERKPRHSNPKAKVADKKESTPHDSVEMNEDSSEAETPRQRKPKTSKKHHPKASTICFRSGCHNLVHPEGTFKSCVQCREADRDRRMFARLGPNTMAEMQTANQSVPSGASPVHGVLDMELGVITPKHARWETPQLPESSSLVIDSHNSEMDAEGEGDEDASGSVSEEDDHKEDVPLPLSVKPPEGIQGPGSLALSESSEPPGVPIPSETMQDTLNPAIIETLPSQSTLGRFRLQHTPLPDSLSYPTTPYYSPIPPRYTPNPVNPPSNPVYIPFLPNPIDNTSNRTENGDNSVNNSDLPPAHDSVVEPPTKDAALVQDSTAAADQPDKQTTLTQNSAKFPAGLTGLGSASISTTATTASPSVEAFKTRVAPNLDLSAFSSNPAAAAIGRILAMNPKMPIDAFTEVLAIEASKTPAKNGSGGGLKVAGVRGGTLMWKEAGSGRAKQKGKEKAGTPVPHSQSVAQASTSIEHAVAVPQNAPTHWRGEVMLQVKSGEGSTEKQNEKSKGKTKSTPSKHAGQEAFESSWKSDAFTSVGPTTCSTSVLRRVIVLPSNLPPPRDSQQTVAGSSKQGSSGDATTTKANASKQRSSNSSKNPPQASISGPDGPPSTMIQPVTGGSQYMAPYGPYPYPYPPVMSQTSYQYPYYPYYYPPYSTYTHPPPFPGNITTSLPSPPPPTHVPLEAKTTQPDAKPTRKRKTRKADAVVANPTPPLESCCSAAAIDSAHSMHMYPSYPYPASSYPPSYGYPSSSYTNAYMQSSYYYPMSTGSGYPYTYPLPTSAAAYIPPPSSTPPLEAASEPIKSNSKGKGKQGSKEAVPDKGPRKRQKFDAAYLENYRAQTQQIQETLERHALIGGGSTTKMSTVAPEIVNSAPAVKPITQAQPLMMQVISDSQPTSPTPPDQNSDKMGVDQIHSDNSAVEPTTTTTNTSAPRKCGYPSCRRTIPPDVHKMLCDRCRIRVKKQAERTKQKHRLQPRKSLNLLSNKRGSPVSTTVREEPTEEAGEVVLN